MKNLIEKFRASLSAQAALIVSVPIVVILAFHSYLAYQEDRDRLFRNTEMQLLRVVEGLKGPAETFVAMKNPEGLQHLVDETAEGADIELVVLFDPAGVVIASNKKKWIGQPMAAMHPEDLTENDIAALEKAFAGGYSVYYDPDDMQYCCVMPIDEGTAGPGSIFISMDLGSFAAESAESAVRIALASLLVAALIGITIFYLLRGRITRRIMDVSSTAAAIARGDLEARTQVRGTDEIGRLAASFNTLADETEKQKNHLEEMVEIRVRELSGLYSVVEATSQSLDLDTMLPIVLKQVLRIMGVEQGCVLLREDKTDALRLVAHHGFAPESVQELEGLRPGEGFAGAVMARNRTIRTGDAAAEKDVVVLPGLEREGIRSVLAAPIAFGQKSLGAITVYSRQTDRFSENEEELLGSIGAQVGVAVENSLLYARTLELTREDGLTGLANRRHLDQMIDRELSRGLRTADMLSFLMCDVDFFKRYNDRYGHAEGDVCLKRVAAALRESFKRASDLPARYGGEEFSVIIPNTPPEHVLLLAEALRQRLEKEAIPHESSDIAPVVTVSIGVVSAPITRDRDRAWYIKQADDALYRSKAEGRNRVTHTIE